MPRKMAGMAMITIEESMVAMSTPDGRVGQGDPLVAIARVAPGPARQPGGPAGRLRGRGPRRSSRLLLGQGLPLRAGRGAPYRGHQSAERRCRGRRRVHVHVHGGRRGSRLIVRPSNSLLRGRLGLKDEFAARPGRGLLGRDRPCLYRDRSCLYRDRLRLGRDRLRRSGQVADPAGDVDGMVAEPLIEPCHQRHLDGHRGRHPAGG